MRFGSLAGLANCADGYSVLVLDSPRIATSRYDFIAIGPQPAVQKLISFSVVGTLMGFITMAGSVGRIVFPLLISLLDEQGNEHQPFPPSKGSGLITPFIQDRLSWAV